MGWEGDVGATFRIGSKAQRGYPVQWHYTANGHKVSFSTT